MTDPKPTKMLVGDEAEEMLLNIFLDGFVTGLATALMKWAPSVSDDDAHNLSQQIAHELADDPAARLELIEGIQERLTGVDSGPKTIHYFGADDDDPGDDDA